MVTVQDIVARRTTITRGLAAIAAALAVASTTGEVGKVLGLIHDKKLVWRFSLNGERNFPAMYSSGLLLAAAALLAFISVDTHRRHGRDVPKWAVLAIGFLYMAFDEYLSFHEMLIDPVRGMLGQHDLGILYFAWVIPGAAVVLAAGLFFLGFLWRLPPWARTAFMAAGAMYVGGALGVELFEGWFVELHGRHNLGFVAFFTVEECLEMAGAIVFISALLRYIAENCSTGHAHPLGLHAGSWWHRSTTR